MGARLARSVFITDPRTHKELILNAGDEPVPWVAELITNPLAWEGGEVPDSTEPPAPDPEQPVDPAKPDDDGDQEPEQAAAVVEPDPEPEPEPEPETAGDEAADPQPEAEPVKRPARRNARKGDAAAE